MRDAAALLVVGGIILILAAVVAALADTWGAWIDRREARREWRADRDERRRRARERAWRSVSMIDAPYDQTHEGGETA